MIVESITLGAVYKRIGEPMAESERCIARFTSGSISGQI